MGYSFSLFHHSLIYHPNIASIHSRWADHLAKIDNMEHSKWEDREAGENIAYVWDLYTAGQTATKLWYDEIQHYDFANPTFETKTGEY